MSKIKDGGPAYPCVFRMAAPQGLVEMDMEPGMSLRDAAALAVLPHLALHEATQQTAQAAGLDVYAVAARLAFTYADAFIAARETGEID